MASEYFERTTGCGLVDEAYLSKAVTLSGWVQRRRDHGGLIFVDLRDRTGIMQVVFNSEFGQEAHDKAHELRSEYVISVTGTVVKRTQGTMNPGMKTGTYELQASELVIHNRTKPLPFSLEEAHNVDEELRLTYRYLDLRRDDMHDHIVKRHKIIFAIRQFLQDEAFYEIETPVLTKSTAEGAREFLVPSRGQKGSFYALPQSPQIYKQMLMASGFERYFQIARCFRDEDLRADRQPEFTQLDIEMSFVKQDDVISLVERLFSYVFKSVLDMDINTPFQRMTYDDAMHQYGTDAPDLRYDMPIHDITNLFAETELSFLQSVLKKDGKIGALHVAQHPFSRSDLDGWVNQALKNKAKGLIWIRFDEQGNVESPIAKFLPDDFLAHVQSIIPDAREGDTLFLIADAYKHAWPQLGTLRKQLARELDLFDTGAFAFVWVTDFPLLEYDEKAKRWVSVHHPFTRPQEGWRHQEQGDIKAAAYDIVMNGVEVGGGSLRIHEAQLQRAIFDFIGMSDEDVKRHFGFLLEAQELGFPPHGGIALGLDRLLMILVGGDSIRDVIVFPKTQRGIDPLMQAPSKVDPEELKAYNLRIIPDEDE
jgi:aspartyl-tRNA synthetase